MEPKARTSARSKLGLALAGLGIAVLVYCLVTRGLSVNPLSKLLLGIGAAAILGSSRALRHESKPSTLVAVVWMLPGALVGLVAAVLIGPPLGTLALVAHELPGLRIGLPPGAVSDIPTTYDDGRVTVAHMAGLDNLTMVLWNTGTLDDEIKAKAVSEGLIKGSGSDVSTAEVAVGGGLPARSRRLLRGKMPGLETFFACGRRVFNVLTVGKETEGLHRRILASVACKPDVAREAAPAPTSPIAVDLPAGWKLMNDAPGELAYQRDDQVLAFGDVPGSGADDVSAVVPGMLEKMAGAKAAVTALPSEGGRHLWTIRVDDGQPARGVAAMWECAGHLVFGAFLAKGADEAPLAQGKALLLAAHCK